MPANLKVDTLTVVYGHLLAFFYRILAQLLRTYCGGSIRTEHANAIAIKIAREKMRSETHGYYDGLFATLIAI